MFASILLSIMFPPKVFQNFPGIKLISASKGWTWSGENNIWSCVNNGILSSFVSVSIGGVRRKSWLVCLKRKGKWRAEMRCKKIKSCTYKGGSWDGKWRVINSSKVNCHWWYIFFYIDQNQVLGIFKKQMLIEISIIKFSHGNSFLCMK